MTMAASGFVGPPGHTQFSPSTLSMCPARCRTSFANRPATLARSRAPSSAQCLGWVGESRQSPVRFHRPEPETAPLDPEYTDWPRDRHGHRLHRSNRDNTTGADGTYTSPTHKNDPADPVSPTCPKASLPVRVTTYHGPLVRFRDPARTGRRWTWPKASPQTVHDQFF